jgi:hypothetical protein
MPPSRGFVPTALALGIAAVGIVLGGGACYRPNIKDGGLRCNLDAGASHACPEGFACDMTLLTCWRGPHGGDGGDVPVDMSPDTDGRPDVPTIPCFDAMPACDPSDASICDPFCQTGCGCHQKCTVNADGGIGCGQVVLGDPQMPVGQVFDRCEPTNDNCAPGLVCLNDQCFGRCYQYCRSDNDCLNSFCSRSVPGGLTVCDVPNADNCIPTPTSGATSNNCPNSAAGSLGCYISFTHPTHTICDCAGGTFQGQPCSGSRTCLNGLLCADPTNDGGASICLKVCNLPGTVDGGGVGCPGALPCQPYTGSSPSNAPNPKYGYCLPQ